MEWIFVFCDHTGLIEFGEFVPVCMFQLAHGSDEAVREIVSNTAIAHYKNLYVPNMQEAKSLAEKVRAKTKYCELLSAFNSFYFTATINHSITTGV